MDGEITEDEFKDFVSIQKLLNRISQTVDSLQLWIENSIVDGKLKGYPNEGLDEIT